MFTGLIEAVCGVSDVRRIGDSMRLGVELGAIAGDVSAGESIAVNGACLTVAEVKGSIATFDVSSETLAKSTLSKFAKGTTVNIERALKADGRFGGHFVQGHIDGTGRIEKIDRSGEFWTVRFKADKNVLEQMVVKGSVAIDGISLTVADMNNSGFETAVIPETIKRTNLSKAKIGDEVNIETDLIVKVVTRQLRQIMPGEKLSIEKLKEMGF